MNLQDSREQPNGWRYRQGRDLAGKTTRRRIRRLGPLPWKCGRGPHLSGARGVRRGFANELLWLKS